MSQGDVPWVQRGMFTPPQRRRPRGRRLGMAAIFVACVAATSATTVALWDRVKASQDPDHRQAIHLLGSDNDKHRVTAVGAMFDDITEAITELQETASGNDVPAQHAQVALKKIRERLR